MRQAITLAALGFPMLLFAIAAGIVCAERWALTVWALTIAFVGVALSAGQSGTGFFEAIPAFLINAALVLLSAFAAFYAKRWIMRAFRVTAPGEESQPRGQ